MMIPRLKNPLKKQEVLSEVVQWYLKDMIPIPREVEPFSIFLHGT